MWFIRIMLRILWTTKGTNRDVLQMARVVREVMTSVRKRQFGYLGKKGGFVGLRKEEELEEDRGLNKWIVSRKYWDAQGWKNWSC